MQFIACRMVEVNFKMGNPDSVADLGIKVTPEIKNIEYWNKNNRIRVTVQVDINYLFNNKDFGYISLVNESFFELDEKLDNKTFKAFTEKEDTNKIIFKWVIPHISTLVSNLMTSAGILPFNINYNDFIKK